MTVSPPAPFIYTPPDTPLQVLHQDHDILVVVKPAGLLSVPGRGPERADCLIARLRQGYPQVLLVHRLDLDTSGVMVFALSPHAQRHLGLQFEKRQTQKAYVARVAGQMGAATGTIEAPLIVDWPNRPRQKIDHAEGRPARTDWQVISAGSDETRVRLIPITGRSHQLRVHMASLGHPILGDPLYATGALRDPYPRLMLHSESLSLRHPDGGRHMTFFSAAPF